MSKLRKALDKAKADRDPGVEKFLIDKEPATLLRGTPKKKQENNTNEINPVYSHTKVQRIDFKKLIKNRIISTCTNNQTADQVKILRAQIFNNMKKEGKNSLLITSANHKEGKTVTAINLAMSLSQHIDSTVLLVDADLRNPSIHNYFGLSINEGLSDYLKGEKEISDLLVNPQIKRLVLLPGGKPIENSSELLGSPRMEMLVEEMKERYPDRFIIFDCSPLLTSADTLGFSRFVDGILIVVEAEKTTKEDLSRTIELLAGKPVIGTIFNKARL